MPFVAGMLGITVLLLVYSSFTWKKFVATVGFCQQLFCDFINYYYPMGKAIFHNGLPVKGFFYSPFNAILLAVFPPLGLDLSLVLWGILQAAAIMVCLLLFHRLVPAKFPIQLLFIALTLFSHSLWLNFLAGNTCMFIMAALLGMLMMVERGHYMTAAILLAFAASFKFYPLIFLAPFIAGRNLRFLLFTLVACIAVFIVIPSVVLGSGALHFYGALFGSFRESAWLTANTHTQFFPHFALRLVGITGNEAPIPFLVLQIVSYCIAAINIAFLFLVQRAHIDHARLWGFQITFLTVPFVLKTSWECDLIFLPFVQAFLVWHIMKYNVGSGSLGSNKLSERKTLILIFVLTSIIFSNILFFNLLGNSSVYGYCGFPFLADILLLIVIYIELLPFVLRRSDLTLPRLS